MMMQKLTNPIAQSDAFCLLEWYQAMGVDEAIADEPEIHKKELHKILQSPAIESFAQIQANNNPSDKASHFAAIHTKQSAKPSLSSPAAPREMSASKGLEASVAEAKTLAASAKTLEELEIHLRQFSGCALKNTAMHTVFIDGNSKSRILILGEAPGADEDKQGIPFCGAIGKLLESMLAYAGLARSSDYILSNIVFWRPPGNRQPTAEEIEMCRPFVEKMIVLLNPTHLLLLGGTASKALLNDARGVSKMRGGTFAYTHPMLSKPVACFVTYHPSYLLRQPTAKREAWADILAFSHAAKLSQATEI